MVTVYLRGNKIEYKEANWAGVHPTGKSIEIAIMNQSGIGFARVKPIAHLNMEFVERVEMPDAPEINITMGGGGQQR